MKFRKCVAAKALTLYLMTTDPLSALAGQSARPGAAYQPFVNEVSTYVSKMGNTLVLKQYARTIGTWPVRPGQRSGTGDETQEGGGITPSESLYVCTRNDQSMRCLALGFSYPNAEDAERGLRDGPINEEQHHAVLKANKAGVQPSWNIPLDGTIEVYEDQGGGAFGCTMIADNVMDTLWEYCLLGVPITVGPQLFTNAVIWFN